MALLELPYSDRGAIRPAGVIQDGRPVGAIVMATGYALMFRGTASFSIARIPVC